MKSNKPEVVVITGASAGVGRATAQAFARRGAHIALIARGIKGLEGARKDVEDLGGKAIVLRSDSMIPFMPSPGRPKITSMLPSP